MPTPFFSFCVQIVYINIDWTRRRKSVPAVLTETVVCLPRNHICLVSSDHAFPKEPGCSYSNCVPLSSCFINPLKWPIIYQQIRITSLFAESLSGRSVAWRNKNGCVGDKKCAGRGILYNFVSARVAKLKPIIRWTKLRHAFKAFTVWQDLQEEV